MGLISWLINWVDDSDPQGVGWTHTEDGTSGGVIKGSKGDIPWIETRPSKWTPEVGNHHVDEIRGFGSRHDQGSGPGGYDGPMLWWW